MVAPLFVISLLWERYDLRSSRLFRPRLVTWKVGPIRRTVSLTNLVSGVLLLLMGLGTAWIGLAGQAMARPGSWQGRVSARLQHYGKVVTDWFSWLPPWAGVLILLVLVALLVRRALRQAAGDFGPGAPDDSGTELEVPPAEKQLVEP